MRRRLFLLWSLALLNCRGAALDVELFASTPLVLRSVTLEAGDAPAVVFALDGGTVSLPATARLLVDAKALVLRTTAVDVTGGLHRQETAVDMLGAGSVRTVRVDLSTATYCPATAPGSSDVVLYDEGPRGRVVFGYDASRLSQPDDVTGACSGARFIRYEPRARYDGFGLTGSSNRAVRRLEFRWRASAASQWLIGLGDPPAWLPTPEACRGDAIGCVVTAPTEWQSVSLEVPASVVGSARVVWQLDSDPPAMLTLSVDDVRVVDR